MRRAKRLATPLATLHLAFAGLIASRASAHPGSDWIQDEGSPVNGVLQVESNSLSDAHRVYGGYGYIGRSEAEAYVAFQAECSDSRIIEDRKVACEIPLDGMSSKMRPARSWTEKLMEDVVIDDLRRHEAEWLIFQLKALQSGSIRIPACLAGDQEIRNLSANLPSEIPRPESLAKMAPADRERLGRYAVATTPLRSDEMIRALLFFDQIDAKYAARCQDTSTTSICVDLRSKRDRIRTSFPALLSSEESVHQDELRSALHELLGSRELSAKTAEDRRKKGKETYDQQRLSSATDSLKTLETQIAEALSDATNPPLLLPDGEAQALAESRDHLNGVLRSIRGDAQARAEQELKTLCSRRTIDEFLRDHPNVVRQAMNDAGPDERARLRLVLCGSPELKAVQPEISCQGVKRLPSGSPWARSLEIDRTDSQYPYSNSIRYTLREPVRPPADAPVEIETTIHVRAGSSIPEQVLATKLEEMQSQTNAFYACMSGESAKLSGISGLADRTACPPDESMLDPRVRYRIRFLASPPEPETAPLVTLHECYRADLPPDQRTDCSAARDFVLTRCRDSIALWQEQGRISGSARFAPEMDEFLESIAVAPPEEEERRAGTPDYLSMTPAQAAAHCESAYPPASDGRYNRESSGNYTAQTRPSTVIHEVGHLLGLADEYQDPTYPFLPQGEHDSIMNRSTSEGARIYSRHLARTLEPMKCPAMIQKSEAGP